MSKAEYPSEEAIEDHSAPLASTSRPQVAATTSTRVRRRYRKRGEARGDELAGESNGSHDSHAISSSSAATTSLLVDRIPNKIGDLTSDAGFVSLHPHLPINRSSLPLQSIPTIQAQFAAHASQNRFDRFGNESEEALLSKATRKRSRFAMLLAQSEGCAMRRSAPSQPCTAALDSLAVADPTALTIMAPLTSAPTLSFSAAKKLSRARSEENCEPSARVLADASIAAANLYGSMDQGAQEIEDAVTASVDPAIPSNQLVGYVRHLMETKVNNRAPFGDRGADVRWQNKLDENNHFLHRFSESAFVALAVVVEELVRDMMQTWQDNGQPLAISERALRTEVMLQLQGIDPNDVSMPLLVNRLDALFGADAIRSHRKYGTALKEQFSAAKRMHPSRI